MNFCSKALRAEEIAAEKKCIALIEEFQGKKKHKLRDLKDQEDMQYQLDSYEQSLNEAVDELEDNLMETEMLL